jgi:hypothetical protein
MKNDVVLVPLKLSEIDFLIDLIEREQQELHMDIEENIAYEQKLEKLSAVLEHSLDIHGRDQKLTTTESLICLAGVVGVGVDIVKNMFDEKEEDK